MSLSRRRLFALVAVLAGCCTVALPGWAQEPKLNTWGTMTGARTLRAGRWSEFAVEITNPSPAAVEPVSVIHFDDDRDLQYARQVWVPANARRSTTQLVRAPSRFERTQVQLHSLFFSQRGREVLTRSQPGQLKDTMPVQFSTDPTTTAYIGVSRTDPDPVFEMIASARIAHQEGHRVVQLHSGSLPAVPEAWDAIDQVVVADDRIMEDSACLSALRIWMIRGGRLAVLLDRVSPATIEALLQDDWTCEVVDRVGLTSFDVVPTDGPAFKPRELEQPVDLVRVIPTGVRVRARVNGWPAVLERDVGQGKAMFVALGPSGWIRRREPTDQRLPPEQTRNWVTTDAWQFLSAEFFDPRPTPIAPVESLQQSANERIGYKVPGRGLVAGVLLGSCGLLLVGGLWTMSRNRLEHFAWLVPIVSILTGTILVGVALSRRAATPPLVVMQQFVALDAEQHQASLAGSLSIYSPDGGPVTLGASRGGIFQPLPQSLNGTSRRMVWTDTDQWSLENLNLPAGITSMPFETVTSAPDVRVIAQFGPSGLEGRIEGVPLDDLALVTESRHALTIASDSQGRFVAGVGNVQSPGTFVEGTIISDEQRRRQEVYQQFHRVYRLTLPQQIRLLGWRDAEKPEFLLPADSHVSGSQLVAVPVQVRPTPAGTRVIIPSPFLTMRPTAGPDGDQSSPYNYRTGEWHERSGTVNAWHRIGFPSSVLPMRIEQLRVEIRIVGPAGRLQLVGLSKGTPIVVDARDDPVGTVRFQIDRLDALQLDETGGLKLGLEVGREGQKKRASPDGGPLYWRIESMQVEAEGTVGTTGN